jgi:hypothetical protein
MMSLWTRFARIFPMTSPKNQPRMAAMFGGVAGEFQTTHEDPS